MCLVIQTFMDQEFWCYAESDVVTLNRTLDCPICQPSGLENNDV